MEMLLTYDFKDQVRQLDELISLIIEDAPTLLSLVGLGTGESLTQTKYEWMGDNLNSNRANAASAAAVGDANVTVAAGDGAKFRVNAIAVIGEEYVKVTAVNGDVVSFQRGFDGTTAASINQGDEIRIVSRPQLQGAGVGIDEGHDRFTQFNYTQIFERFVSVSKTQMAVKTHGVGDELNYQVQLRLKELAREFNDALIYSRRIQGQPGVPSMAGGLLYFADAEGSYKHNMAGAELTAKAVNDAFEEIYKRGGAANTIILNTAAARQFSKIAGGTLVTQRQDTATGHVIKTFVSDLVGGGQANLVVDPNFPKNKVALLDVSSLEMPALRALYDEDASIAGHDYVARQIRGEYGIRVKNAKEKIAIIENVSPTVS